MTAQDILPHSLLGKIDEKWVYPGYSEICIDETTRDGDKPLKISFRSLNNTGQTHTHTRKSILRGDVVVPIFQ